MGPSTEGEKLFQPPPAETWALCTTLKAAKLPNEWPFHSETTLSQQAVLALRGMSAASAQPGAVVLQPLTNEHLPAVRTLNSVLFPVKYHERVYQDALACGPVSQLAFQGSTLVGAILCRLEALAGGGAQLYIISLGVLAPYREQGIASKLLAESLAQCKDDDNIRQVLLHVHTANKEALDWYQHRGFKVQEVAKDYYKRMEPRDAAVLVKQLTHSSTGDMA